MHLEIKLMLGKEKVKIIETADKKTISSSGIIIVSKSIKKIVQRLHKNKNAANAFMVKKNLYTQNKEKKPAINSINGYRKEIFC